MLNALSIAQASERLTGFVMGTNDLVKELYAEHVPGRQPVITGLGLALLAARAAGIVIIDGVYNDVKNLDGFLAEVEQGRQMGFDGKTLIHPGQVEGANDGFAPSEQAIEDARGLIQAWEDGQGQRRGHLQRPDGREPPRRVGRAHPRHRRRDRRARRADPSRARRESGMSVRALPRPIGAASGLACIPDEPARAPYRAPVTDLLIRDARLVPLVAGGPDAPSTCWSRTAASPRSVRRSPARRASRSTTPPAAG